LAYEQDYDLFGNAFNDSRMDHCTGVITYELTDGVWSALGPAALGLGQTDCKVRLVWTGSEL